MFDDDDSDLFAGMEWDNPVAGRSASADAVRDGHASSGDDRFADVEFPGLEDTVLSAGGSEVDGAGGLGLDSLDLGPIPVAARPDTPRISNVGHVSAPQGGLGEEAAYEAVRRYTSSGATIKRPPLTDGDVFVFSVVPPAGGGSAGGPFVVGVYSGDVGRADALDPSYLPWVSAMHPYTAADSVDDEAFSPEAEAIAKAVLPDDEGDGLMSDDTSSSDYDVTPQATGPSAVRAEAPDIRPIGVIPVIGGALTLHGIRVALITYLYPNTTTKAAALTDGGVYVLAVEPKPGTEPQPGKNKLRIVVDPTTGEVGQTFILDPNYRSWAAHMHVTKDQEVLPDHQSVTDVVMRIPDNLHDDVPAAGAESANPHSMPAPDAAKPGPKVPHGLAAIRAARQQYPSGAPRQGVAREVPADAHGSPQSASPQSADVATSFPSVPVDMPVAPVGTFAPESAGASFHSARVALAGVTGRPSEVSDDGYRAGTLFVVHAGRRSVLMRGADDHWMYIIDMKRGSVTRIDDRDASYRAWFPTVGFEPVHDDEPMPDPNDPAYRREAAMNALAGLADSGVPSTGQGAAAAGPGDGQPRKPKHRLGAFIAARRRAAVKDDAPKTTDDAMEPAAAPTTGRPSAPSPVATADTGDDATTGNVATEAPETGGDTAHMPTLIPDLTPITLDMPTIPRHRAPVDVEPEVKDAAPANAVEDDDGSAIDDGGADDAETTDAVEQEQPEGPAPEAQSGPEQQDADAGGTVTDAGDGVEPADADETIAQAGIDGGPEDDSSPSVTGPADEPSTEPDDGPASVTVWTTGSRASVADDAASEPATESELGPVQETEPEAEQAPAPETEQETAFGSETGTTADDQSAPENPDHPRPSPSSSSDGPVPVPARESVPGVGVVDAPASGPSASGVDDDGRAGISSAPSDDDIAAALGVVDGVAGMPDDARPVGTAVPSRDGGLESLARGGSGPDISERPSDDEIAAIMGIGGPVRSEERPAGGGDGDVVPSAAPVVGRDDDGGPTGPGALVTVPVPADSDGFGAPAPGGVPDDDGSGAAPTGDAVPLGPVPSDDGVGSSEDDDDAEFGPYMDADGADALLDTLDGDDSPAYGDSRGSTSRADGDGGLTEAAAPVGASADAGGGGSDVRDAGQVITGTPVAGVGAGPGTGVIDYTEDDEKAMTEFGNTMNNAIESIGDALDAVRSMQDRFASLRRAVAERDAMIASLNDELAARSAGGPVDDGPAAARMGRVFACAVMDAIVMCGDDDVAAALASGLEAAGYVRLEPAGTGSEVDPEEQEVVGTEATGNEALDGLVAAGVSAGWSFGGEVLRRERVRAYRYVDPDDGSTGESTSGGHGDAVVMDADPVAAADAADDESTAAVGFGTDTGTGTVDADGTVDVGTGADGSEDADTGSDVTSGTSARPDGAVGAGVDEAPATVDVEDAPTASDAAAESADGADAVPDGTTTTPTMTDGEAVDASSTGEGTAADAPQPGDDGSDDADGAGAAGPFVTAGEGSPSMEGATASTAGPVDDDTAGAAIDEPEEPTTDADGGAESEGPAEEPVSDGTAALDGDAGTGPSEQAGSVGDGADVEPEETTGPATEESIDAVTDETPEDDEGTEPTPAPDGARGADAVGPSVAGQPYSAPSYDDHTIATVTPVEEPVAYATGTEPEPSRTDDGARHIGADEATPVAAPVPLTGTDDSLTPTAGKDAGAVTPAVPGGAATGPDAIIGTAAGDEADDPRSALGRTGEDDEPQEDVNRLIHAMSENLVNGITPMVPPTGAGDETELSVDLGAADPVVTNGDGLVIPDQPDADDGTAAAPEHPAAPATGLGLDDDGIADLARRLRQRLDSTSGTTAITLDVARGPAGAFDNLVTGTNGTPYYNPSHDPVRGRTSGDLLMLVAQVNLATLPDIPRATLNLPSQGLIQFFAPTDGDGMNWSNPTDQDDWRIRYVPEIPAGNPPLSDMTASPRPKDDTVWFQFNAPQAATRLTPHAMTETITSGNDYGEIIHEIRTHCADLLPAGAMHDDGTIDGRIFEALGNTYPSSVPAHMLKIGGHPQFSQQDAGIDWEHYDRIDLMQLDSYGGPLKWGDNGIAHLTIPRTDIPGMDLSNVEYRWDS